MKSWTGEGPFFSTGFSTIAMTPFFQIAISSPKCLLKHSSWSSYSVRWNGGPDLAPCLFDQIHDLSCTVVLGTSKFFKAWFTPIYLTFTASNSPMTPCWVIRIWHATCLLSICNTYHFCKPNMPVLLFRTVWVEGVEATIQKVMKTFHPKPSIHIPVHHELGNRQIIVYPNHSVGWNLRQKS